MAGRANIRLLLVTRPGEKRERLGVYPDAPLGLLPHELEAIAQEAGRAVLLVHEAPPIPLQLLLRVVKAAPDRELRFPFVATLERFLAALDRRTPSQAAALSDQQLSALWRKADKPPR